MTPEQLAPEGANNTEHSLQTAFFCALASAPQYLPTLTPEQWELTRFMFAVPSGGARDGITAGRMKAEGVKPGVPDTFLPVARGPFNGLWIEFKKPERQFQKDGGLSGDQIKFKEFLTAQKFCFAAGYGWRHGIEIVRWYLTL